MILQDSEDELPECSDRSEVCSKVDLYGSPWVERQCRCPDGRACPSSLHGDDGHTIVDKTRQYKLCEPVKRLPICRYFKLVAIVRLIGNIHQVAQRDQTYRFANALRVPLDCIHVLLLHARVAYKMAVCCLQRRHMDVGSWRGSSERDGSASLLPMSARQRTLSSSKASLQIFRGKSRIYLCIRVLSSKRKFSCLFLNPRPYSRSRFCFRSRSRSRYRSNSRSCSRNTSTRYDTIYTTFNGIIENVKLQVSVSKRRVRLLAERMVRMGERHKQASR